ncbi:hypothetical protein FSP39_018065 [Pinctada imbricata]|uniref:Serine/threonine-protein kinase 19 n=1 Tax=Pinctada imbricata TaxID=66713 RepID=A0AA88XT76_PINIB|nr:hypothetical protein FSP39_018065 [Pinctada imbricata]
MSRKRALVNDLYKSKKRICAALNSDAKNSDLITEEAGSSYKADDIPCDTKVALLHLQGLFPVDRFDDRIPAMIIKHQLYSILPNRTLVDKQLNDLKNDGEVKLFKLGVDMDDYCIMFTSDYKAHVQGVMADLGTPKPVIEKFTQSLITKHRDVCISKETLMEEYQFTDQEITHLVKASVLTVKTIGGWWIAVPNAGIFMKSFLRGRKALLRMISKSKYREILRKELEQRKWPKICKLGLMYHLHDVIGADLIQCIETTSGQLLRLKDS